MTIDPEVWKFVGLLLVNIPIWYVMRANLKKTESGAYSELMAALRTSGQTIDDLFKQLSEVPALQRQVGELREELRKRDLTIEAQNDVIREQNLGIGQLMAQLVNARIAPAWKPRDVLATIPPKNKAKRQGG
jgi:hypothetical protein